MVGRAKTSKIKTHPARPTPCRDVSAYPLDDNLVLCDSRTGQVFELNESGALIWAMFDGRRTNRQVARMVATRFKIDNEQAHADVEAVVADLERAGLLTQR